MTVYSRAIQRCAIAQGYAKPSLASVALQVWFDAM